MTPGKPAHLVLPEADPLADILYISKIIGALPGRGKSLIALDSIGSLAPRWTVPSRKSY